MKTEIDWAMSIRVFTKVLPKFLSLHLESTSIACLGNHADSAQSATPALSEQSVSGLILGSQSARRPHRSLKTAC